MGHFTQAFSNELRYIADSGVRLTVITDTEGNDIGWASTLTIYPEDCVTPDEASERGQLYMAVKQPGTGGMFNVFQVSALPTESAAADCWPVRDWADRTEACEAVLADLASRGVA